MVGHQDPETQILQIAIAIATPNGDLDPVALPLRKPIRHREVEVAQDLLLPVREDVPQTRKSLQYARMNPSTVHTGGNDSSTVI